MNFTTDILKRRIVASLPDRGSVPATEDGAKRRSSTTTARVVDVSALLLIEGDDQFLRDAYRLILGRECDITGFIGYREMLRNRTPRAVVLHNLVASEEARRTGTSFTGVWNPHTLAGTLRHRISAKIWSRGRSLMARCHEIIRYLLFRHFDLLDHKVDYLVQQLETRTDRVSSKTDESLWTVSEKLDAYISDLRTRQIDLSRAVEQVRSLTAAVEDRVLERLDSHTAGMDAHVADTSVRRIDLLEKEAGKRFQELETFAAQMAAKSEQNIWTVSEKLDAYMARMGRHFAETSGEIQKAALDLRERQSVLQHRQLVIDDRQASFAARLSEIDRSIAAMRAKLMQAGGDVLATEVDGFILGSPAAEWRMAAYLAFRGVMEPGLVGLFRRLVRPGMVVVDAGANIGIFTLHAARLVGQQGRVYSFEPTPRTFQILKDNVQVNGFLETGIVVLEQVALSDRSGVARLVVFDNDCGHNTLFPDDGASETVEIQTVTLDESLARERRVDIVKIDIEGAEAHLLRGMTGIVARNPEIRLLMEFAPRHLKRAGSDPENFLCGLERAGWFIERIDDLTGELRPAVHDELLRCFSVNLSLSRPKNIKQDPA